MPEMMLSEVDNPPSPAPALQKHKMILDRIDNEDGEQNITANRNPADTTMSL